MAIVLFIDESGHDRRESPYEVLAGVGVRDSRVWELIRILQAAEERCFGVRLKAYRAEFKAKKLLSTKVHRHAAQMPPIAPAQRALLTRSCLEKGRAAAGSPHCAVTREELTALGQAKLAFCDAVLSACRDCGARVFASVVDRDAPRGHGDFLRKDYAYLFQRFFSYLDRLPGNHQGLVVFDELERSQSHLLIGQMERYFIGTAKGRHRASRVIPEPFFVHSDLTTLIQVADLVAYLLNWAVRVSGMHRPARDELAQLAKKVLDLRHVDRKAVHHTWSVAVINDLRPREERTRGPATT